MVFKKVFCKGVAVCSALLFMLFIGGEVFGQIAKPIGKGTKQTDGVNHNSGSFERVEEFFFSEMYDKCLSEIQNARLEGMDSYQRSVIGFYNGICNAYVLKKECGVIIENFIETSRNEIYINIARAILAQEYLKHGNYSLAESVFKKVDIPFLPTAMQVRCNFYYGVLFFETGQYAEAKYRFVKASVRNDIYDNDIIYYLSYIKYIEKDYAGALEGFEALTRIPKYADASIYIAQIKFQLKDYDYIIGNFENFSRLATGNTLAELYRIMGESYYNMGDYRKAVEWLKMYQEEGGALYYTLNYILGYSFYTLKNYDRAISHFIRIIDGENEMIQNAYYHLADAHLKTGDKKGALTAFSMAATMEHDIDISRDALYNQIKLSYEIGSTGVYTEMIELMQRFINKYPESEHVDEINGYLVNLYINSSDYDRTIYAIESIPNPSPQVLTALQRMCYERGINFFKDQYYIDAIDSFDKTMTHKASQQYNALAQYWKAEALYKIGENPMNIVNTYKDFIKRTSPRMREHMFAHYNIGYVYFNDKQWKEAQYWFGKFNNMYHAKDSYKSDAQNRLGDIQFALGKYNNAIKYYQMSKKDEPTNIDYSDYQIALSWGLANNQGLKTKQLRQIIDERESIYKELAIIELAYTYNKWGKHKECEILLKKYILNNMNSPYYPVALQELGVATSNQNKHNDALRYYKMLIEQFPQSQESNDALLAMKSIYVSQGNVSAYFDFMQSIGREEGVSVDQKQQLSFESLQQQYLAGKTASTISLSRSFLSQYPNSPNASDATFFLAECLMKNRSTSDAIEAFERLVEMPSNQHTVGALLSLDRLYSNTDNLLKRFEVNEKIFKYTTDKVTKQRSAESMIKIALKEENEALITDAYNAIFSYQSATKESMGLAYFGNGKVAFKNTDYPKSWASLRRVSLPASMIESAETEYMKAYILYSEKKYNDAEELILAFNKRSTPHQYWMARCFILLGDIYLARNDLFQAKATYQSLVDGYTPPSGGDDIIGMAMEKVAEVTKLDKSK